MPVSVARKIEFFIRNGREDLDVRLFPVALTAQQCAEYKLPRIPIKESERRKDSFELIHGTGATELDALETIHPGVLAEIVGNAMDLYFDDGLEDAPAEAESDLDDQVDAINEDVYNRHRTSLADLKERYQAIRCSFGFVHKQIVNSKQHYQNMPECVSAATHGIDLSNTI
jgi:hypothetical protein